MHRTLAIALLALAGCAEPTVRPDASAPGLSQPADGVADVVALAATAQTTPPPAARPPDHLTLDPDEIRVPDTRGHPGAGIFGFVGVYHAGEAPAADGERWLGLYPTDAGWALEPVTVRTRTAPDPLFGGPDGPENPPTGVEVVTDRTIQTPPADRRYDAGDYHDDGRFFVRADALTPGPIASAFSGAWTLTAGDGLTIGLPSREPSRLAVLHVRGRPYESVLTLDSTPVLHLHDRDAGHPTLLWAGDLDRDGALDLVLDASPHYNATVLQLWLSSASIGGAPLGLVAEHGTVGC